ncbi:response regulator [[Clostridium] aminophilum]|uniref:Stage 0 sporulation protein A homolog n=1 Tax=[Clostridium] aminophilum TaxID=1526 RepID=A0A1I6J8K0_9FIRM|nr:response regulator [[Clostridium] aminophilum]SET48912.1 Response regulator receiver domain-containing protein [[Clostridium] aminophilum]SFR75315.1 Response regulator receiver domain-containing protein [[Clostridium] aminophilum]
MEQKKKIVIVDDDLAYLKMMRGSLAQDYSVIPTTNGAQALNIIKVARPDLVLLDYMMPGMDGADVLAKLRSNPRTAAIPVMFLTGKNDSESVHKVLGEKPEGYILKSMSILKIAQVIEDYFKMKDRQEEMDQL